MLFWDWLLACYMNPRKFENGTGAGTRRELLRILVSNGALDVMLSILIDDKWDALI